MYEGLRTVLILLTAAVLVVALARVLRLPSMLAYLAIGIIVGPHALGWLPESEQTSRLAEFGVVFLMFSIGLEFSLTRLIAMRWQVFGLGGVQVVVTMLATMAIAHFGDIPWQGGLALGAAFAMSSTAIVAKLLAEKLDLHSSSGRRTMSVLLFQDIAVVPLLIILPALSRPPAELGATLGLAAVKAAVMLSIVLVFGQRWMRAWFSLVARRKSGELFMLNILLITLGLAWLSEQVGLSLALGAFLAGMLISETEFRYEVEEDIKPFRDVLLGLFFVTVGMFLDVGLILSNLVGVLALLVLMLLIKFGVVALASRAFGSTPGTAMRSGLWLCAGGEFGFVMISSIDGVGVLPPEILQITVAALVLSMLVAPLIVQVSDRLVLRFVASEWLLRSMELTRVAAQAMSTQGHVIICGYGRSGQYLARFVQQEGIDYVALDLDPERVREAAAAGDTVVYGDAARRETLVAAGVSRASAMVVSFAGVEAAMRVLHHAHALRPDLPVVVRAVDESDLDKLTQGGAAEVVPEAFEGSIMLASHALALIGVPINRVVRRIREIRSQRYEMMRGFFHGATDDDDGPDAQQQRLHSVVLPEGAHAVGRSIADMQFEVLGVAVLAVRRRNIRGVSPDQGMVFLAGDTVVLRGTPGELGLAEQRLMRG